MKKLIIIVFFSLLFLSFQVFAVGTLDQSNTTGTSEIDFGQNDWSKVWVGIPFTAGVSGILDEVEISVQQSGGGARDFDIEIWSDDSGSPDEEITGTSGTGSFDADWTFEWQGATVDYDITEDENYWIVVKPNDTPSNTYGKIQGTTSSTNGKYWNGHSFISCIEGMYKTYVTSIYCGDGVIEGDEVCDDSDSDNGDGCSSTCTVENLYQCESEPSVCELICSNGEIDSPPETCDDSDTDNGDGCSSICVIETGWLCTGEPSVCSEVVCGDGDIEGDEDCDDGNTDNSDGCSSVCEIESNYQCQNEPSDCDVDITCWEECTDGGASDTFAHWVTCGYGSAEDYPESDEQFCIDVVCWETCDDGAESDDFNAGTVCGTSPAGDFPLNWKPFCDDYYSFECNVKYYNLCDNQTDCEALGANYEFENNICHFLPDGSSAETVEIDALNQMIDDNNETQSIMNSLVVMLKFILPILLTFSFVGIALFLGSLLRKFFQ